VIGCEKRRLLIPTVTWNTFAETTQIVVETAGKTVFYLIFHSSATVTVDPDISNQKLT
jgi:hypothetical protein